MEKDNVIGLVGCALLCALGFMMLFAPLWLIRIVAAAITVFFGGVTIAVLLNFDDYVETDK